MDDNINYEIERRFLISMPNLVLLEECGSVSEISQTYLLSGKGCTARVRSRATNGKTVYTHTEKHRISAVKREENERVIDVEEYERLLNNKDPERNTIKKRRYCRYFENQCFEIDIFPFFTDRAIMEIELENEEQKIVFPPEFEIIKEVTGDGRYTNAAMALSVPYDNILFPKNGDIV